ncbi:MAG: helix-turn-helix domain-containing protein [Rhodomicrobium sp.]
MITPEQIKAARALLRMEQDELARRASVSVSTIRRLEAPGECAGAEATFVLMALQEAGVEFIADGVCLKRKTRDAGALFEKLLAIAGESARQLDGRPALSASDLYHDDGLPK